MSQKYPRSVSVVFQMPLRTPQVARKSARDLLDATMKCPMRPSGASQVCADFTQASPRSLLWGPTEVAQNTKEFPEFSEESTTSLTVVPLKP